MKCRRRRLFVLLPLALVLAAVPRAAAPQGAVRADRRAFSDAAGSQLALGATMFWALWGERNDAARLDRNLAWLAARDFNYVRVLAMVGGPTWKDRAIDPGPSDYWKVVDALGARAARHGLRLQVTLFAEAGVMMPRQADREAFVDRWADWANRHRERVQFLEVANEYHLNGLTAEEVRELTVRLASKTDALVAASAPPGPCASADEHVRGAWTALYGGAGADVLTVHLDRRPTGATTHWAAAIEPWKMRRCAAADARMWINNEPIGPQSSVVADDSPERLAFSAALTWLAGGAGYTLHTGAGVRGGGVEDRARGRAANIWDVPNIQRTADLLRQVREALPGDLPNWTALDWSDTDRDPFELDAARPPPSDRVFTATDGGRRYVTLARPGIPITLRPRRPGPVRVYQFLGGRLSVPVELAGGASVRAGATPLLITIGR